MPDITFKAKPETVYNPDDTPAYTEVQVPTITTRHCDMPAFRTHSPFGSFASTPQYHATVEKIETASAEKLAEIAGAYTAAVTALIIEGETLSTEDYGSAIELTEITTKAAPTTNLEPSHGR